jgi:tetratricopeptide (TPR) repeat protein
VIVALLTSVSARAAGDDPDTEVARRHFDLGASAYREGQYETAAAEFEQARRIKPLPAFDFNLGRTYDRMERVDDAIAAYERYLGHTPLPPDADEVRARIAVLRGRRVVASVSKPAPAPAPARPPVYKRWWFWTALAGVAVAGAGVGLAVAYTTPKNASIPSTTDGNVAVHYP